MIWNNRFIKIIVLVLGVFILALNFIIYLNQGVVVLNESSFSIHDIPIDILLDPEKLNKYLDSMYFYDYNTDYSMQSYFGFGYFFDKFSQFPGLTHTLDMLRSFGNVVGNFSVTGNNIIDFVIAIFRVISTPIAIGMTLFMDIVHNLIWIVSFIVDGINNPNQGINLHRSDYHYSNSYIETCSHVPLLHYFLRV